MLKGIVKGGAYGEEPAAGAARVAGSEEGGNWKREAEGRVK